MRLRLVTAFSLVCAPIAASCSLLGLDDFPVGECTMHTQCDGLNTSRGIAPDACERYQCLQARCTLAILDLDNDRHADAACAGEPECVGEACDDCDDLAPTSFPGGSEICDGVDNDCNGFVDDASNELLDPVTLVTRVAGATAIGYAPFGEPANAVGVTTAGAMGGSLDVLVDETSAEAHPVGYARAAMLGAELSSTTLMAGCVQSVLTDPGGPPTSDPVCRMPTVPDCSAVCQTHEECQDGTLCNGPETCEPESPASDANGCRAAPPMVTSCTTPAVCSEALQQCVETRAVTCSIDEIAVSRFADARWFAVAVDERGCELAYVGYMTESADISANGADPGRNILLRGDDRRSTVYRGVDPVQGPMGTCTGGSRAPGETAGVSHVAIASLPADPTASRTRPQALTAWLAPEQSGTALVEVLGLFHEQAELMGTAIEWVTGTNDGIPQPLDVRTTSAGAAPALLAVTAPSVGYLIGYGAEGGGVALRFIPALPTPEEVGDTTPYDTNLDLGDLADCATCPTGWTCTDDRCVRAVAPIADLGTTAMLPGGGSASAVVSEVAVATGPDATLGVAFVQADGVWFSRATLSGSATPADWAPVQLSPTPTVSEVAISYAPEGMRTDIAEAGGWYVVWIAGGEVRGQRISEADGAPVDAMPMMLVPRSAGAHRPHPARFDVDGHGITRVLYHSDASGSIDAVPAFCGPF